jgi:hypothetical protein
VTILWIEKSEKRANVIIHIDEELRNVIKDK